MGLVAVAVLVSACSVHSASPAGRAEQKPRQGGSLTFELPGDPGTLSPFHANYAADGTCLNALYDTLVWESPLTGTIHTQLADSLIPSSADASQWTLKLKPGIRFSDGEPLNAQAVKFNWDKHADPQTHSQQQAAASFVLKSTVADDLTLTITLRSPNVNFDRMVAENLSYIAAPDVIRRGTLDTDPVGAGPFLLKSGAWIADRSLTVSRNPGYWQAAQGLPHLDSVVFRPPTGGSSAAKEIRDGRLDLVASIDPAVVAEAESDSLGVQRLRLNGGTMFTFDTTTGPMANTDVRRAFALALNGQDIVDRFYGGKGTAAHGIFSAVSPLADNELAAPEDNPAQAASLFDKVTAGGTAPITITISTVDVPTNVAVTEYVASKLNAFRGVHVLVQPLDISRFIQQVDVDQRYDAAFNVAWINDPEPSLYTWLYSQSLNNCCHYRNPEVDTALDDARRSSDSTVRRGDYTRVQMQLNSDMPFWVFMEDSTAAIYSTRVTGVQVYGNGEFMLDRIGIRA